MSDKTTAFQRHLLDHGDPKPEFALRVFRLLDNYEMSEQDATTKMLEEVEELIGLGPHPVDEVLNEIIVLFASSETVPDAETPTPPAPPPADPAAALADLTDQQFGGNKASFKK